jgi:hypothetical protein
MSEDIYNNISINAFIVIKQNLITICDLNNLFEKYKLFSLYTFKFKIFF